MPRRRAAAVEVVISNSTEIIETDTQQAIQEELPIITHQGVDSTPTSSTAIVALPPPAKTNSASAASRRRVKVNQEQQKAVELKVEVGVQDGKKEEDITVVSRKRKRRVVDYIDKEETEDEEVAQKVIVKKAGRGRGKKVKEQEQSQDEAQTVAVAKAKGKGNVKRVKKAVEVTTTEVKAVAVAKVKRPATKKKVVKKKDEDDEEEEEELDKEEGENLLDEEADEDQGKAEEEDDDSKPKKKPRKPRKKKETGPMIPFAARAKGVQWLVGAHVSMAKGVQNAVTNTVQIGGNAFALFLKGQRKWANPDLKEGDIAQFREFVSREGYDAKRHILPHGSYLINLAQHDEEKHKQAYDSFLDDLKRCHSLGIGLYNFHPGHTLTHPRPTSLLKIATSLNSAHKAIPTVVTVLENMAGHGDPPILGSTLEDLRDIIHSVTDKSRVGVCIDTAHAFAAGYDLRTKDAFDHFWDQFDRIVGAEYLKAMHLNDSKAPFGARRDLHHHIGQGYLGLEAFRLIMNCERLKGIPLVLETPMTEEGRSWAEEIKLLESLVGVEGTEKWFLEKAAELQKLGKDERERIGAVVEKRKVNAEKKELRAREKEEKKRGKAEKSKKKEKTMTEKVAVGKRAVSKKVVIVEEAEDVEAGSEDSGSELSELSDIEDEEDEEEGCKH